MVIHFGELTIQVTLKVVVFVCTTKTIYVLQKLFTRYQEN